MELNENRLINACQKNGDTRAFEVLIQKHQARVRGLVFKFFPIADELDDISQEVFIKAFKNIKSYRYESQFSTWLCQIAVNTCKDHIKKRKLMEAHIVNFDTEELNQIPDNYTSLIEDKIALSQDQKHLVKALKQLPFNQQLAIILHDIEDFTCDEIAGMANCPVGTVKSRIFNARKTLKDKLKSVITSIKLS